MFCYKFNNGYCNDRNCKLGFHKICKNNLKCIDVNCMYGHGTSLIKRHIINHVYNKHLIKNQNNLETCFHSINCYNENCNKYHELDKEHRIFIKTILNKNITDDISIMRFEDKYKFNLNYFDDFLNCN